MREINFWIIISVAVCCLIILICTAACLLYYRRQQQILNRINQTKIIQHDTNHTTHSNITNIESQQRNMINSKTTKQRNIYNAIMIETNTDEIPPSNDQKNVLLVDDENSSDLSQTEIDYCQVHFVHHFTFQTIKILQTKKKKKETNGRE